jgi:hypothetical protein
MALSSTEMNKVMQLLGYGAKTIQAGSVIYNKIVYDRLTLLPVEAEALVRTNLAVIATIETQMAAASTRLIAKKVGDIELNNRELEDIRRERKRISKEIACILDIPYQAGDGINVSVVV